MAKESINFMNELLIEESALNFSVYEGVILSSLPVSWGKGFPFINKE